MSEVYLGLGILLEILSRKNDIDRMKLIAPLIIFLTAILNNAICQDIYGEKLSNAALELTKQKVYYDRLTLRPGFRRLLIRI